MRDPDQAGLPRKWAERLSGDNTLADLIGAAQEKLKKRDGDRVRCTWTMCLVSKSRTAYHASLRTRFWRRARDIPDSHVMQITTGDAAYLKSGGTREGAAAMANHASTRTTQLYDRRRDEVSAAAAPWGRHGLALPEINSNRLFLTFPP
jgi:hypothetical protein